MERKRKIRWRITCSKCKGVIEPTRMGKQAYCKKCHAASMRLLRPKHYELTPLQRMKSNARSYANVYQRRGMLKKQPCETCGSNDSQKHHEDYSKPLQVTWKCRKCHLTHHQKQKEVAAAA